MSQDQNSSATTGCVIAAVVAVVLMVCGGGALVLAGLLFVRSAHVPNPAAPAPPVEAAHVDVLAIEADGSLLWNDQPLLKPELARRLDELKAAPGPPRSVMVRVDPAAPPGADEDAIRQLQDRGLGYILEGAR